MLRLENKVAVITGANSGVGKATALRFASEGAKVVLCARREGPLQVVVDEINNANGEALGVVGDIGNPETAKKVIEACMERFKKLDILVNCAGVIPNAFCSVDKCHDDSEFERVMTINAKGTFYMTREALPYMIESKGGSIVNVASVSGSHGFGDGRYCVSKGGVIALTKHTAIVHSHRGINCNAICPATIITPMIESNVRGDGLDVESLNDMKQHVSDGVPLNTPETVAATILFFASDEAKNITGQIIDCDYGYSL